MNRWRTAALIWLASGLVLFPHTVAGQQASEVTRLLQPNHQTKFSALLDGGLSRWDKSYLVTFGFNGTPDASSSKPSIIAYDRTGNVFREATVWLNNSERVSVGDAAVTKNGKLVVTGSALDSKGVIADFVASIGDDGHLDKVIRTSPFLPVYVASCDAEGTVWIYGKERYVPDRGIPNVLRLRNYSFEKGELAAMLEISGSDPGWTLTGGKYADQISLRCNSQTVVLYNAATGEYINYEVKTKNLRTIKVGPLDPAKVHITGFALTESGDVFASLFYRSKLPRMSGLFKLTLDGKGGAYWVPISATVGPYLPGGQIERLLGTDGTDLVHTRKLDGEAYWSEVGKHSLPAQ